MSPSPATPSKAGKHANEASPKLTMAPTEKPTSTSKMAQASLYEPSPASTYGDTAGSSAPATPLTPEELGNKKVTYADHVAAMLGRTHLDGRDGTLLVTYSSPSHNRTATTVVRNTSASSSPGSDRVKAIRGSPNWRPMEASFVHRSGNRGINFVRRSGHEADDVFGSPGHPEATQPSGEGNDASCNTNQDHAAEPISNDNAQALLSPSACVFVANLMQTQTDDQLEHHVSNAFSQFGVCYVKIRRDANGMPFAFVQYETAEDAQRAITQGRGMPINGRACRTEVAKVNRSLYLSRVTGGPISEAEARNVLSRFGEIEKVWYSTPTEGEIFRLPEGIWVMYKLFQPSRDAQAGFRDHPHYRLEQPPTADNFRSAVRSRQFQSISPMRPRQSPGRMLPSPMRRATTTDLRSIFVGNLPATITEEQLFHIFDIYGAIQHIEIVRKPSTNVTGVNAFAFIEYLVPEGAEMAIQASPRIYGDVHLRIERKESTNPSPRRNGFMASGGSPRGPYLGDSPDHLAIYQRGWNAGLTQAQAIPPPVWAPFSYYQPYDPSHYGAFAGVPTIPADNNAAASLQSHANGYATQAMGQFQYPQAPGHYFQYPQQSTRATYQWPPTCFAGDNTHTSPNMGSQETH